MLEQRFKLPGLELSADVMGQRLQVKYDAAKLSTSTITAAVADAGMRAWLEHEEPVIGTGRAARWQRMLVSASGAAFVAGLGLDEFGAALWIVRVVFAVSIACGGALTLRKAVHAARMWTLDINVLMLSAAMGAIALGQWSEAAAVVFLFAVAQALETRTLERARTAIGALMKLTPVDALVRSAEGERRIGVEAVLPGMVIVVRPGEKIPLDGEVVAGNSDVNQSPVTGESLPADKSPGAEVFAGTINRRAHSVA
jgi:Cd2+/Zn2+-exporting ATPase